MNHRCVTVLLFLILPLVLASGEEQDYRLALIAPIGEAPEKAAIDRTALRRIPEILGIPYRFIESPGELESLHAAVLAAGPSNKTLSTEWRKALYSFVDDGGVLLVPGPVGSQLYPLTGIESLSSRKSRESLTFEAPAADPLLAYLDRPEERTISLGNGEYDVHSEVIWSHGIEASPMSDVLARFDDGSAGLVRTYYGRGIVYFLGLSFEETVMLPQTGGDYEAQRRFVNSIEPSADVIMLLIKALYEEYAPFPVYLSSIPGGRPTALILSHDVDAQTSFVDSLKFAALAEEFGTRATFFINTKYFTDAMDIGYYVVPENLAAVRELAQRGHEIGSHSVAHSYDFTEAPPGSPEVNFSNYRPETNLTINGEARVSKELLDRDIRAQNTISFRAGFLAFPPELIDILEKNGYRYDSSFSANDVLTSFPFFAFTERRPGAPESSIVEIPVTMDDALEFLTEETTDTAVHTWKTILDANAGNESITVLLIHPSDTRNKSYKLLAQRALMEHARDMEAWMGTLAAFGEFWHARHETEISRVFLEGERTTIQLSLPEEDINSRIALVLPGPAAIGKIRLIDSRGRELQTTADTRNGKLFVHLR